MLNEQQIEADVASVFIQMKNFNGDDEQALKAFSKAWAKLLVKHIKTLEIVYSTGLTAGANPVIGTINHTVR